MHDRCSLTLQSFTYPPGSLVETSKILQKNGVNWAKISLINRSIMSKTKWFVKQRSLWLYEELTLSQGAGIAPQSFSSRHLEKLSEWDDDKIGSSAEVIKLTATSLYAGASDTTVSAMRSFLLAMTIYPDVQRKAQGEIDNVVGPDRLPGFADRPLLPYCDRIMKEVLRWGAIGPLGVPHVAKEDDVFEGYNIEKGTILVPNIWYAC